MAAPLFLVLRPRLVATRPGGFILLLSDRVKAITQRSALRAGSPAKGTRLRSFRVERIDARLHARCPGDSPSSPSPLPAGRGRRRCDSPVVLVARRVVRAALFHSPPRSGLAPGGSRKAGLDRD